MKCGSASASSPASSPASPPAASPAASSPAASPATAASQWANACAKASPPSPCVLHCRLQRGGSRLLICGSQNSLFVKCGISCIGQVSNKTPSNSEHQNSTSVLCGFWYTLRFLMILDNCKLSDMCPMKSPKNPEHVQQIMSNEQLLYTYSVVSDSLEFFLIMRLM